MLYKPESNLEKIAYYLMLFVIVVGVVAAIGYAFYFIGL